jgi:hypothetical protein
MRLNVKERKIINAASRLSKAINRAFSHDSCPFTMEQAREIDKFREAADHLRWSYPLRCKLRKVSAADRLKTMFSGPLYTSDLHPWPLGKKGQPLEPICQIDLTIPSRLSSTRLGDGLLQLWMDGFQGHLRIVPKNCVKLTSLTSVSSLIANYVWKHPKALRLMGKCTSWNDGYLVNAIDRPVLTVPDTLVAAIDERPTIRGKLLNLAFDALEHALQHQDITDEGPGELGLFGNFANIQYREIDRPDTLLIMESGALFTWGNSGNAQIFYRINNDGNVSFSFDWSSY